jgi:hypothetical protein
MKRSDSQQSHPKSTGTSRRRLCRAVTGSGGLALGAVVLGVWRKPVVKAVALPAHAQTSVQGCRVSVALTADAGTSSGVYSVSLFVTDFGGGGTYLNSGSASDANLTVTGSALIPPGSEYHVEASVSRVVQTFQPTFIVNASCCDASGAPTGFVPGALVGGFIGHQLNIDDGSCQISLEI